MKVDIIIVNWNAGHQLVESIASVARFHESCISSVIVVDNASVDRSLLGIEALSDLPFRLHIIRNVKNRGFAAACNQGAAIADAQFLLFLNPDTRVFEHSFSLPLTYMERPENSGVGIVGIQLVDERNEVSRTCARFPSLAAFFAHATGLNRLKRWRHLTQTMVEWNHDSTQMVDQVMGAFFLVRHSLFKSLRGFDERFFVYFEEVDFSLRARRAGWSSVYLVEARAFHAGGGVSNQVKAHRLFYSLRSRILYAFKHFSATNAWTVVCLTMAVEPISRLIRALGRGSTHEFHDTLRGYRMLWSNAMSFSWSRKKG